MPISLDTHDGEVYLIQFYVIYETDWWFQVLHFYPPIKKWLPQYNWNIVESGIKYHNPNP